MTSSDFVKKLIHNHQNPDPFFTHLVRQLDIVNSLPDDKLPPLDFIQNIGSAGPAPFRMISADQLNDLARRYKIQQDWTLLDLGCGCGRTAIAFKEYLNDKGHYIGIDVWPEGIEWCQKNFPENFTFKTLHAEDNYYYQDNRKGVKNSFTLDFIPDNSVDLCFAISLFTHLTDDDAQHYLNEIFRVLKEGRCAHLTCFIIDDYFHEYRERMNSFNTLKEESPGFFCAYKRQDFFAGYTLESLRDRVNAANLEMVAYELGTWAEKPGAKNYQDLIILRKKKN